MANILVNKDQWDSLTPTEQGAITKGLQVTGAIKAGDRIVGDSSAPPFDENTQFEPMWNPIKDLCKVTCDTAASAAVAWCIANTAGTALAVCTAAAEAARTECRRRC